MHPRGGKLGFVTVSLENGQGEKYFILMILIIMEDKI